MFQLNALKRGGILKGQISVEYLMVIGFVAVITIPLVIIYYTYTADSSDEIIASQIGQIARKIVDAAESVYFLGSPSQTTLKVYIPNQIAGASLDNKEVLFNISTRSGISEIVQVSSIDLTGSLPTSQGAYTITLKARENDVEVSYK